MLKDVLHYQVIILAFCGVKIHATLPLVKIQHHPLWKYICLTPRDNLKQTLQKISTPPKNKFYAPPVKFQNLTGSILVSPGSHIVNSNVP